MILLAGVFEPDLDRVRRVLGVERSHEQQVLDEAMAFGEVTAPEWAAGVQNLVAEKPDIVLGSAISAGFVEGYLTMFPHAEIVLVLSDPVKAMTETRIKNVDVWNVAMSIIRGHFALRDKLDRIPHVLIDMTQDPSDDAIAELLAGRQRAA